MVTVPEVKLEISPKIKEIVAKKLGDKYINEPDSLTVE